MKSAVGAGFKGRILVKILALTLVPPTSAWVALHARNQAVVVGEPRLEIPDKPLYLGEGKEGQIVDGSFLLRNEGDAPLTFRLDASCGCSDLSPKTGTIGPKTSQTIRVGIRLDSPGTEKTVTVHIDSNDRRAAEASYRVSGLCAAPFLVSPNAVHFGRILQGKSAAATLTVRHTPAKTGRIVVESKLPRVRVVREKSSADETTYSLRLSDKTPLGFQSGQLVLTAERTKETVLVPLAAEVIEPIVVVPKIVRPGQFADEGSVRAATFFVFRADGRPLGRLGRKMVPEQFQLEELSRASDVRRRFRVEVVGEDASNSSIALFFDGERDAVRVPIVPASR